MNNIELPTYDAAKKYFISPEGLQKILSLPKDDRYPAKNILWTDDFNI